MKSLIVAENELSPLIRRIRAAELALRSQEANYDNDGILGVADILSEEIDRLSEILYFIADCRNDLKNEP